jgi:hypothetical protein
MDRIIVYPGAIPLDTDLLSTNRNTMIALHALISATLGTNVAVDGLTTYATVPASMQITVSPGSITQYGALDANAYGSLPADLNDPLVKMGVLVSPQTFTVTAPATAGTAIAYLVQGSFSETDQDPVVLPYYNAANPAMPYLGPGNSGASQATVRQQSVVVQLKAGTPAPYGTQLVPVADPGFVGLGAVLVTAGQTQVTAANIYPAPLTRFTPWKLPDLTPGFAFSQAFAVSGTFTVPPQITRLRITVIGGGGGGGGSTSASAGGGGGGGGGRGTAWLYGLTSGAQIAVTVGGGGSGGVGAATGAFGGTSSFGSYCSATGGAGGTAGTSSGNGLGATGGGVVGTSVSFNGSMGSDAIPGVARGGDGGGPGGGKGSSSGSNGSAAPAAGGGGGGASGAAFAGGAGAAGLVVVEW